MSLRILGVFGAALLSFGGAHADWQYTKFGMTQDEVKTAIANRGLAVNASKADLSDPKVSWLLSSTHEAAGDQYKATFGFEPSSGRLMRVKLEPISAGVCTGLRGSLSERYGKVESDETIRGVFPIYESRWTDSEAKNYVEFSITPVPAYLWCAITYSEAGGKKKSGL